MDQPMNQRSEEAERRLRIIETLKDDPVRSDGLIALKLGAVQSTVYRVRKELEASGEIPVIPPLDRERKLSVRRKNTEKIARIRAELFKDPLRTNPLIARLCTVDPDTVRHERKRMETNGEIKPSTRQERINIRGAFGNKLGPGAGGKFDLGESITVMGLAAKGLEAEKANPSMTMDEIALLLGINVKSYRSIRSVYELSRKTDLTKADTEIVRKVVQDIEHSKQITPFLPAIEKIAKKVWGSTTGGGARTGGEQKRKHAFNHAVGLISDTCGRGPEVEVPYLTEAEQVSALQRVSESISCLKQLATNIRRARE